MSTEREMTLDEWVNRLPEIHSANIEYKKLKEEVQRLTVALVNCKTIITAEENRGTSRWSTIIFDYGGILHTIDKALGGAE